MKTSAKLSLYKPPQACEEDWARELQLGVAQVCQTAKQELKIVTLSWSQ